MCSKASRVIENLAASEVVLSTEELKDIESIMEGNKIKGSRYVDGLTSQQLHLWG